MLINFSVSNFRSFYKSQTFSMKAGKVRNFANHTLRVANTKLLKFKAVYGSNASGKTNLVKAIDFMRSSVVYGINNASISDYCRLNVENANQPSRFEIDIILAEVHYTYGFEVLLSESRFTKEWLFVEKSNKRQLVFSRDIEKEEYNVESYCNDAALNKRLGIYADDIKADSSILFLYSMNQNKDSLYAADSKIKVYQILYRWFKYKLIVNYPDDHITQYTYFFDSQGSVAAEEFLRRFDTGISKVNICDEPAEKVMSQFPPQFAQNILDNLNEQKIRNNKSGENEPPAVVIRNFQRTEMYLIEMNGEEIICKTLKFNHNHSNSLFALKDESDGTRRLLDLIEILLLDVEDVVYVIDEINRCLHPLITKQFVKDFLEISHQRNIQLIATTHETDLMDLGLLRQDEIGFIEKRDTDGASIIFGLEDYGARFDKKIRTAYMKGEYKAVPKIQDIQQML